jgi:polar amino acid transport system substrate-binding protein
VPAITDPRIADIVEAGRIRLALFLPQYVKEAATGDVRALGTGFVATELVSALAASLGVTMQVIEQPTPPAAVECLKAGGCDVALMGIEPSRAALADFTPPVLQFDYAYLVPSGSSIRSLDDVDRPGVRIATVHSHASALALKRMVKHAVLVGAELPEVTLQLLRDGEADVFAFPRAELLEYAAQLPGARVLEQAYGINHVGMAVAKGQPGRLAYLSAFVEEAKASGLVQRVIERGGLHGFRVSPPERIGAS